MVSDFDRDTTARVLILIPEEDIGHFSDVGLVKQEDESRLTWLRRDRDAERDHLKEGKVCYSCAVMHSDDNRRREMLRELLDPAAGLGYCSTLVPYGPHPDFSNQIVRELSEELGDRSRMSLLVYLCCGSRPYLSSQWWGNGRTCIIPIADELTYEEQKRIGRGFSIDDDLAYFVAHAQRPHLDMPGVSVGSLIVANSGVSRFYLARRNTGDAKGTFGTIGGPLDRGMSFIESLRNHAMRRAGLSEEVVAKLREGPVLACTNLIGQIDHSVDITFLVTVDKPFKPVETRYMTQVGWYTFEQLAEMYRASSPRAGSERSYSDPYREGILFAPVRNAFEGYCLLLLSGTIGETLLPVSDSLSAAFGYPAALKEERSLRKGWLKEAAIIHEKISDGSLFLHEELRRDQA